MENGHMTFLEKCDAMKEAGLSEREIAAKFNLTTSAYRKRRSMIQRMKWIEMHNIRQRLREADFSEVEIKILCGWSRGVPKKDF